MKRLIIVALSLASLGGLPGATLAQAPGGPVVVDDASGADGTCRVSGPASDQVILCSDLRPGRGVAVHSPGAAPAASNDAPDSPAPEPAPEAPPPETTDTTDTAVASATDQDADNIADELEPGLGLDPTNPDTDGDGVADGDEPNIYGTDPLNPDTDGDGASDGRELFALHTDPVVWNDFGAQEAGTAGETP